MRKAPGCAWKALGHSIRSILRVQKSLGGSIYRILHVRTSLGGLGEVQFYLPVLDKYVRKKEIASASAYAYIYDAKRIVDSTDVI